MHWPRVLLCIVALFLGCLLVFFPLRQIIQPEGPAPEDTPPPPALEQHPLDERFILVLDAGHGGHDPGAVDGTGTVYEAVINRLVAARLQALLEAHPQQLQVITAYGEDSYTAPLSRANTAAYAHADLLLSLHLNAAYAGYESGFSCYPAPPGRAHHDESVRFAQYLVQRVGASGSAILGQTGIWYAYYRHWPNYGYEKVLVDGAVNDPYAPRSDESFGVVDYAGCPAVLAELWFISNAADMVRWNHEAGYEEMAACLYLAVCDYFDLEPKSAPAF